MKKLGVGFVSLLWLWQFGLAQVPKTNREQEGLKGNVRSVIAQRAKLSNQNGQWVHGEQQLSRTEAYDQQGKFVEIVSFDYMGNMNYKDIYTIIDGELTAKTQYFHHDYDPPPPMAPPSQGQSKPRDPRYDVKYKFKYAGNTVERTAYWNDGSQAGRRVSTYDGSNKIKAEAYGADGKPSFSSATVYGDKGEELVSTSYLNGVVSNRIKYTDYEIDRRGNWIQRKMWMGKDAKSEWQPYEMESRTITYFDDAASKALAGSTPPDNRPKVIRVSTGVLTGKAIKKVPPVYPAEAKARGLSGEVLVEVTVDEQGDVLAAEAVTGDPILAEAAVAAVRQWKFAVTKLSGQPLKVIGRIRFNFNR